MELVSVFFDYVYRVVLVPLRVECRDAPALCCSMRTLRHNMQSDSDLRDACRDIMKSADMT